MMKIENSRITRKVFLWDNFLNNEKIVNTWYNEVKSILYETNFQYIHKVTVNFLLGPQSMQFRTHSESSKMRTAE